jgi:putative ABC transport system ATP-binding protein
MTRTSGICSCPAPGGPIVAELMEASKVFRSADTEVVALQRTDLQVFRGELMLIFGPSGSGKTTLLSLLGCVLYPTEGCVCIGGVSTGDLDDTQMAALRLREIGFVFQQFNLVAPLNCEENVMVPLQLQRVRREAVRARAARALALVGLSERRRFLPRQLSGGEQQRVAIARALVTDPGLILCDEPTASLDATSMQTVLGELRSLADAGKAVAVVTHDPRLERYADRIIRIENGAIVEERRTR